MSTYVFDVTTKFKLKNRIFEPTIPVAISGAKSEHLARRVILDHFISNKIQVKKINLQENYK